MNKKIFLIITLTIFNLNVFGQGEKKEKFYLVIKDNINNQIKYIDVKPEILLEHHKKIIERDFLKGEYH